MAKTSLKFDLFLFGFSVMCVELAFMRVLDALFSPQITYFFLTAALSGFSLSAAIWLLSSLKIVDRTLSMSLFVSFALVVYPILTSELAKSDFLLKITMPILSIPFFLSGIFVNSIFFNFPKESHSLYFFDMIGLGLGAFFSYLMLPLVGPQGLIALACSLIMANTLLSFSEIKSFFVGVIFTFALILSLTSLAKINRSDELWPISEKYLNSKSSKMKIEHSSWEANSRIDVVDFNPEYSQSTKYVFFDGGTIGTNIHYFDGDFNKLKENYFKDPLLHFTRLGAVASHFLMQNRPHNAFLIGVGAGQEVKAALMYGAKPVFANELQSEIIELINEKYAVHSGGVLQHPDVKVLLGDGRQILTKSEEKYDIVQIFSNYLSTRMQLGKSNLSPTYLFTVEAFEEYFSKLTDEGILHINQYDLSKLVSIAKVAWERGGRTNFNDHVLVSSSDEDILPTFLIKMTRWSEDEISQIRDLFLSHPSKEFIVSQALPDYESQFNIYDDNPYYAFNEKSSRALLTKQGWPILISTILYIVFFIILSFSKKAGQIYKSYIQYFFFFTIGVAFIILQLTFISVFLKINEVPMLNYSLNIMGVSIGIGAGSYFLRNKNTLNNRIGFLTVFYLFFLGFYYDKVQDFLINFTFVPRAIFFLIFLISVSFPIGGLFPRAWKEIENDLSHRSRCWLANGFGMLIGGVMLSMYLPIWGFHITFSVTAVLYLICILILNQFISTR